MHAKEEHAKKRTALSADDHHLPTARPRNPKPKTPPDEQELKGHTGVVWTMKFSRNGRYLATAGQDCEVLVWRVSRNAASPGSAAAAADEADTPRHLQRSDFKQTQPAAGAGASCRSGSGDAESSGGSSGAAGQQPTVAEQEEEEEESCAVFESDHPLLEARPVRRYQV